MGLPSPEPPCFLASQTNGFLPGTAHTARHRGSAVPARARHRGCQPCPWQQLCHSGGFPVSCTDQGLCGVCVPGSTGAHRRSWAVLTSSIDLCWIKSIDLHCSSNSHICGGRDREICCLERPRVLAWVQAVSPWVHTCSQPGDDWGILAAEDPISELSPFSFDLDIGLSTS